MQPVAEAGQRSQLVDAGDLIQEGPVLLAEQVGDTVPDAAGVHRQSTLDVGVLRPDQHPAGPAGEVVDVVGGDGELGRPDIAGEPEAFHAAARTISPAG